MIRLSRVGLRMMLSTFCLFLISTSCTAQYELAREFFVRVRPGARCKMLFSPDGKRVAVVENYNRVASDYGEMTQSMKDIAVWDLRTGELEGIARGHNTPVSALAFSPDGEQLLSGDWEGVVKQWQVGTLACLATFTVKKMVSALAFQNAHEIEQRVIVGMQTDEIYSFTTARPALRFTNHEHTRAVSALTLLATGAAFISASWDHSLRKLSSTWQHLVQSGSRTNNNVYEFAPPIVSCDVSGDNQYVVAGYENGRLELFAVPTMDRRHTFVDSHLGRQGDAAMVDEVQSFAVLRVHELAVSAVKFSYDGGLVFSGSYDRTVKVWERESAGLRQTMTGFLASVCALMPTDNYELWVGCDDGHMRWYVDREQAKKEQECREYEQVVAQLAACNFKKINTHDSNHQPWLLRALDERARGFSQNASRLCSLYDYAAGIGKNDRLNTLMQQWIFRPLEGGHRSFVATVAAHPDGRIVSGSLDCTIKIWDSATGVCLQTLQGHAEPIETLAFLSDGSIVSGSRDGTVRVWDSITGDCRHILRGHKFQLFHSVAVAVLPDDRIVSGAADKKIKIWNSATGVCEKTMSWNRVRSLLVTPEGYIIAGSDEGEIGIWESVTGILIQQLKAHKDEVQALALLPDGTLVSGGRDGVIRFWNRSTGELSRELNYGAPVVCMTVLPEGQLAVVIQNKAAVIQIIESASGKLLKELPGHSIHVTGLATFPDGRLVSGSWDCDCKLWDCETATCLQTFFGSNNEYAAAAMLPNFEEFAAKVLPDSRILSSSAEHHSRLGIWMRLGEFIKGLSAAKNKLVFKFIQDPGLTYYHLDDEEKAFYRRLPYMNNVIKIIREHALRGAVAGAS